MKPLELTPQHKSKILEMCGVLFPEYIISEFIEGFVGGIFDVKTTKILAKYYATVSISYYIHWHELSWKLLNQLATYKKLLPTQINKAVHLFGLVCFNQFPEPHPIDYLYDIFKSK